MLAESIETQKFVVQSLAAALAKAKKQADEREKIYTLQLRASELTTPNGLPEVEFQDFSPNEFKRMQNDVAKF